MFTITKRFTFAAAHYLTCVPPGHKCARTHGHTYTVEVELAAEHLRNCMVVDYGDLAAFGDYLTATLDHQTLNLVLPYEPTAERIAEGLFEWCRARWPETTAVRVEESPTSSAEYRP